MTAWMHDCMKDSRFARLKNARRAPHFIIHHSSFKNIMQPYSSCLRVLVAKFIAAEKINFKKKLRNVDFFFPVCYKLKLTVLADNEETRNKEE